MFFPRWLTVPYPSKLQDWQVTYQFFGQTQRNWCVVCMNQPFLSLGKAKSWEFSYTYCMLAWREESGVYKPKPLFLFFSRWLDCAGPIKTSRMAKLQERQNFFEHLWRIWSSRYRNQLFPSLTVSWKFGFFICLFCAKKGEDLWYLTAWAFPSLGEDCG